MRTRFEPVTGRREWIMDAWYQKAIYILGVVSIIGWGISIVFMVVAMMAYKGII